MKLLWAAALSSAIAACGGGGGDPAPQAAAPPAAPTVYPVKDIADRMNLFVGSVTTRAPLPGAPAGNFAVVESVTSSGGVQDFDGVPANVINGRVRSYAIVTGASNNAMTVVDSTAYYEVGANRFLGSTTNDARTRPIGAPVTLPASAASGARGALQQTETVDLAGRRRSLNVWSWSLTEIAAAGPAWLCQSVTVEPVVGASTTTEVCALANAQGAILGWRGSQSVPGYGQLTFTQ